MDRRRIEDYAHRYSLSYGQAKHRLRIAGRKRSTAQVVVTRGTPIKGTGKKTMKRKK